VVLQRLRERGWLLDLKTRGVWEFEPAARGGAYGAGDSLIELRATLARRPDAPFAVAAESAAYLLGYASRRPTREVVSAPAGVTVPPALRAHRILFQTPVAGSRQGRLVLIELTDAVDSETGERYTVKRYGSEKAGEADGGWRHVSVTLSPLNPGYEPIVVAVDDEAHIRVVAEVIEVLASDLEWSPAAAGSARQ